MINKYLCSIMDLFLIKIKRYRDMGSSRENYRFLLGIKRPWVLVKSNGPVKIKALKCVISNEETQFLREIFKVLIVMYENNFQK